MAAAAIIALSLGVGVLGYHCLEGMGWLDALLNAPMILGGMGSVDILHTEAGNSLPRSMPCIRVLRSW